MRTRWILMLLAAGGFIAESFAQAVSGLTPYRSALRTSSATGRAAVANAPAKTAAGKAAAARPALRFNLQFTELGSHAATEGVMERVFSTGEVAQFNGAVPLGASAEQLRQQAPRLMRGMDLARERFQVALPSTFSTNNPSEWGLLVWCSPGAMPDLPRGWLETLERHKLILVSALNNGNARTMAAQEAGSPFPFCYYENLAGALAARHNMVQRYGLNEGRVFVSGHSGGASVASIVSVCFPDQFTGAIPFMACRSYVALPGSAAAGGPKWEKYLDPNYDRPPEAILAMAREQSRFAIVAGAGDTKPFGGSWKGANRQEAELIYQHQFQKEGYKNARFILAPCAHGLPGASVLDEALRFVTGAL